MSGGVLIIQMRKKNRRRRKRQKKLFYKKKLLELRLTLEKLKNNYIKYVEKKHKHSKKMIKLYIMNILCIEKKIEIYTKYK